MNSPTNIKNKIYKQGITLIIDSFSHTKEKDLTAARDSSRRNMYESGNLEHEDTPVDEMDQPKLIIHNKNEIPVFFDPFKRYLTLGILEQDYNLYVREVQIPLKVVTILNLDLIHT